MILSHGGRQGGGWFGSESGRRGKVPHWLLDRRPLTLTLMVLTLALELLVPEGANQVDVDFKTRLALHGTTTPIRTDEVSTVCVTSLK